MTHSLTNQSRKVLALANEAARSLNHSYVGTEHILLGLIEERSAGVSDVLETFEIDADKIRTEIERLIQRGAEPVALQTLPLTPRASQAIDHAHNETRLMGENCIGPEHLFLGLINDPAGVACQVLLNLGVIPFELRKEVFKVRVAQMKIVERIVRPVRASTPRKRKMREELLAHLSAIYDQEQAKLQNPAAALETAALRLGDPTQLAHELQSALPFHEGISYFVERLFGWRAPETVPQYALRQSVVTFCILAMVLPLVFAGVTLRYGWFEGVWTLLRTLAAIVLITLPAQFVFTTAAIKMRDSIWGIFGSQKSLGRALLYAAAIAVVVMASLVALSWAGRGDWSFAIQSLNICAIAGVVSAITSLILVRLVGSTAISDTYWAMLEIDAR